MAVVDSPCIHLVYVRVHLLQVRLFPDVNKDPLNVHLAFFTIHTQNILSMSSDKLAAYRQTGLSYKFRITITAN